MKKIFYKPGLILTIVLLLAISVKAQLPLVQGDAVVTHSPARQGGGGPHIVLRVIKTSNTGTAPMNGNPWLVPAKPSNSNYSNWADSILNPIFGITLDDNTSPNIYVSNTQIYGMGSSANGKVWRIDGTTGANTLVHNFNNVSRSLGNLKYLRTGGIENIYVSNWDDGKIHRLTGSSAGTSLWIDATTFNPKFGLAADDPKYLVYGIALRSMSGGAYRLYYARISTAVPNSNNEIWSVDLGPNGDFLPATEAMETLPPIATIQPIADIAFTSDGKRMLLGQQSWAGFAHLTAHQSSVAEFKFDSGHNWIVSGDIYPSGTFSGHTNAVGGVSYSNNILQKDQNQVACDTTAWFTSDAATLGSSVTTQIVYGIIGMRTRNNGVNDAVFADEDDYTLTCCDKTYLGDVEVYKKPLNCGAPACACGSWQSTPSLNGNPIHGVPVVFHPGSGASLDKSLPILPTSPVGPPPLLLDYPIQFVKGNVSGLINAVYQCTGNCGATYAWTITSAANATIASGTTLPVDLAQYNGSLQCGNYNLSINAKCGNNKCGGLSVPITIICEPTDCCKATIDINLKNSTVNAVTNIENPNAYSNANFNYNLSFNTPMSEVRVSVEDFQLVANSPNCLNCNNRPVTWGNILSAGLNGTSMTLTGASGGPATGSLPADYREAVYSAATPLAPTSAALNIRLSLPAITELSCCEVSAYVCLKFTFKDAQCHECVKMVCGNIKLVAPSGSNNGNGKVEIRKFDVVH